MGLLSLKSTMAQPKPVVGVSPCDTEGPCKVWGKLTIGFQISLGKIAPIFFKQVRRSKFQILWVSFV